MGNDKKADRQRTEASDQNKHSAMTCRQVKFYYYKRVAMEIQNSKSNSEALISTRTFWELHINHTKPYWKARENFQQFFRWFTFFRHPPTPRAIGPLLLRCMSCFSFQCALKRADVDILPFSCRIFASNLHVSRWNNKPSDNILWGCGGRKKLIRVRVRRTPHGGRIGASIGLGNRPDVQGRGGPKVTANANFLNFRATTKTRSGNAPKRRPNLGKFFKFKKLDSSGRGPGETRITIFAYGDPMLNRWPLGWPLRRELPKRV